MGGLTPPVVWPVLSAQGTVWFVCFHAEDAAKLARYGLPGRRRMLVQGAWPL